LEDEDLERQSLYGLLERRYGYRLQSARQTIEATTASAFESDLLEIAEGAPLLVLEGITTTDLGIPIEWFQAIYRADRVKIGLESLRESQLKAMAMPPVSVLLTSREEDGKTARRQDDKSAPVLAGRGWRVAGADSR
jgi:hypothetical protein